MKANTTFSRRGIAIFLTLGVIAVAAVGFGLIYSRVSEGSAGARAMSLSKQGSQLRETGRYAEARPVLREALIALSERGAFRRRLSAESGGEPAVR